MPPARARASHSRASRHSQTARRAPYHDTMVGWSVATTAFPGTERRIPASRSCITEAGREEPFTRNHTRGRALMATTSAEPATAMLPRPTSGGPIGEEKRRLTKW